MVSPRCVCPGTGLTSHPVGKQQFHKGCCVLVSDYTQCKSMLSRWLSRHPWREGLTPSSWRVDSLVVAIWFKKPPVKAFSMIIMLLKYLNDSNNAREQFIWQQTEELWWNIAMCALVCPQSLPRDLLSWKANGKGNPDAPISKDTWTGGRPAGRHWAGKEGCCKLRG